MVVTDHPRKRFYNKSGRQRVYPYVFEHHLVMEQSIGRFLKMHELVHHIDGNRLNNDISNLYLCTGPDVNASRIEHNSAHQSLEDAGLQLFKLGIIDFSNGSYSLSMKCRKLLDLDSSVI